jgi:4-amino-4-deoxy-L-arabinose transferase-like glycosyltransferase
MKASRKSSATPGMNPRLPSQVYLEKSIPRRAWLLFAAVAAFVLFPCLGDIPLSLPEALAAWAAQGLNITADLAVPRRLDADISLYPLYPALIRSLAFFTGSFGPWAVRFPAVLGMLGMAGVSTLVAARKFGRLEGAVAGAVTLTMALPLHAARQGCGETLFAALIAGAWFVWYWYGRNRKRWGAAWTGALLMVLLAAMLKGIGAFVFFYFPLLFLRRPLRIWQRMASPVHLVTLAVSISAFLLWYYLTPFGPLLTPVAAATRIGTPAAAQTAYLWNFLLFPLKCLLFTLPWTPFLWPGYCAAFRAVEPQPVFARFLRTLILPLFLAAWLIPGTTPETLLPLACPAAVMCSMHYGILVRRHHRTLRTWPLLLLLVTLIAALLIAGIGILLATGVLTWRTVTVFYSAQSLGLVLAALMIIAALLSRLRHAHIYLRTMLAAAAANAVWLAAYCPWQASLRSPYQQAGASLARHIPENVVVYQLDRRPLVRTLFYMDRQLRQLAAPEDLPTNVPVVFVIAGERPPILETRIWQECSPVVPVPTDPCLALEFDSFPGKLTHFTVRIYASRQVKAPGVRAYWGRLRELPENRQQLLNLPGNAQSP